MTHPEALEQAICYGWIDGQRKSFGTEYWLQKFTPRGPNSIWSQVNVQTALRLIDQGKMQPAGLAAIERAKTNGRWEAAYAPQRDRTIPDDLGAALAANPRAAAFFQSLGSRNRYAILFRVQTARKPETRSARIQKFVAMLERGETLH